MRKGPYGHYVQLGEDGDEKPKRVSLPRGVAPDQVTLDLALGLLALPRVVGDHPETKKPILAGLGRFGPYLQHDGKYKSIPKDDDVLTIGLNRAVDLLAQESKGRGRGAAPGKPLGNHPEDNQPVTLHDGRYGHYVKWGKVNATIPKDDRAGLHHARPGGRPDRRPRRQGRRRWRAVRQEGGEESRQARAERACAEGREARRRRRRPRNRRPRRRRRQGGQESCEEERGITRSPKLPSRASEDATRDICAIAATN